MSLMRDEAARALRRLVLGLGVSLGGTAMVVCGAAGVQALPVERPEPSQDARWDDDVAVHPPVTPSAPAEMPGPAMSSVEAGSAGSGDDEELAPGSVIADSSGFALDAFYQALSAVEREREPGRIARLAWYGDSHTATDVMTGHVRRRLQERFGDAGHGFIAAGNPWPSYRHLDIRSGSRGRWTESRIRNAASRGESDGLLGLAGAGVQTEHSGSLVWVSTALEGPIGGSASRFELFYLARPGGGRIGVFLDDAHVAELSTQAAEPTPGYHVVQAEDGPHDLRIEALGGGPVRLFGTVVERSGPGVVVDSLGINGARITAMLAWDESVFVDNLARRSPDLVVLWYGANSVGDDWYEVEQYEQWVIDAASRVRRAVPGASCLVVGPPDMARATLADHGPEGTPPNIHRIIAAERDAAELAGCGFFDLFEAMGGEGSTLRWADHEPSLVSGDGIHFSAPGYRELADLFLDALMAGYEQYLESNPEG
jgi:lysophospholipase L1-like esterase